MSIFQLVLTSKQNVDEINVTHEDITIQGFISLNGAFSKVCTNATSNIDASLTRIISLTNFCVSRRQRLRIFTL
jgi:hypothetical protein